MKTGFIKSYSLVRVLTAAIPAFSFIFWQTQYAQALDGFTQRNIPTPAGASFNNTALSVASIGGYLYFTTANTIGIPAYGWNKGYPLQCAVFPDGDQTAFWNMNNQATEAGFGNIVAMSSAAGNFGRPACGIAPEPSTGAVETVAKTADDSLFYKALDCLGYTNFTEIPNFKAAARVISRIF